ncbi:MAG: hypothetical protein A3F31_03535 [Candidatus Levybacteria bacterium RIFCSPHIGHO2_12_FULL_38_12]|nr:MAG: hypothetical protein A2770_00090 [Candidatus Levybacteria bacterium RIFCSPHIGHO2_01_FULL_38_12]OGH22363.1 MAG: hypothetical protein A3D75_01740 [Candidatus Levybacteria bacterium RIFCSPHIGHO2_02_FULL_37_18]OGH23107.1 MAG: hypothetical protein A3F31_03535 [Candidatus Levybacteria bacterium RIFCSPHIGHO2_12_FULL_38_12]OGH34561.1 MAG: hypothetical protein A3A47_00050 [Candidatus Levybacteria bacterium RIFCSPLOWO2_01_FULL_37_20]OGH43677.1 MAG: hypothetical protein A3J14_03705 [Candidatus Lev
MTTQNTKKTKHKQYVDTNPIEAVRDIGTGIVKSTKDQGKSAFSDLWAQLLGASKESHQESGELAEGQELDLSALSRQKQQEKETKSVDIAPGIDYRREILQGEQRISAENTHTLETQIRQIIVELKRLANSSQILEAEFREITVEQRIEKPGKYHITFFEWMLAMVKAARIKVEDSGAWLSQFESKKKQKQYWQMFKKHGTTFGLSNERVVATQTG